MVKAFAPAKINLSLHITGQRKDGYHLLDSLVMFADIGDRVSVMPADETTLSVGGPMGDGVPVGGDNLVMQVADLFDVPVAITLSKHLPMAAGIGGGSTDAAATALALCDMLETRDLPAGIVDLGADIRVCLMRRAARMSGIGDVVDPLPGLPQIWAVLANPGLHLSTQTVFQALQTKRNTPMPARLPQKLNAADFIEWLAGQRNDLEPPARAIMPEIDQTLACLADLKGAGLARMSGSGATCFALFDTQQAAVRAAQTLATQHPGWWVRAASLG